MKNFHTPWYLQIFSSKVMSFFTVGTRRWGGGDNSADNLITLMLPTAVALLDQVVCMLLRKAKAVTWQFLNFNTENLMCESRSRHSFSWSDLKNSDLHMPNWLGCRNNSTVMMLLAREMWQLSLAHCISWHLQQIQLYHQIPVPLLWHTSHRRTNFCPRYCDTQLK